MSFLLIKVGRSDINDIQINDERVDEKHLEIFRDVEGNVYLTDLNSKQGTFVNDNRISESVQLQNGDNIKIANAFMFDWKAVLAKADENSFSIGTDVKNKIRLAETDLDPLHIQLYKDFKGNIFVHDLKSINGTFINGHRIQGVALIKKGDRLKLGKTHYNWEDLFVTGRLMKVEEKANSQAQPIEVVSEPIASRTENTQTEEVPQSTSQRAEKVERQETEQVEAKPSMSKWMKIGIVIIIDVILLLWLSMII